MTILIDEAIWPWRGERWAHLVSDESYDELHEFAERLGVPRRAFQGDHYDLPARYRDKAIELGATPVPARELARRLRAAGLRRRKGRPPASEGHAEGGDAPGGPGRPGDVAGGPGRPGDT